MSIIGSNILAGAAGSGVSAYEIEQSLRFNSGDSTKLSRTFSSDNSNANFTVSFWCKRGELAAYNSFIAAQTDASNYEHWMWYNNDSIGSSNGVSGTANNNQSTAVFRDPSAWYHVVWKNVASGATTVHVNGTQVLSFTRQHKAVNKNVNHNIGVGADNGSFRANFYLAEYHLVDGSALDPTEFAEYDDNGVWRPIKYTGSYGTNGAYLKFDPSATNGIGHDHSGNGNNWTASGFTTSGTGTDVMSDTPTTNWCTLNPLTTGSYMTLSNGNLDAVGNTSSDNGNTRTSFVVTSGKFYFETTLTANRNGTYPQIGIMREVDGNRPNNAAPQAGYSSGLIYGSHSIVYQADGTKYSNASSSSYGDSFTNGDVIGVAYDGDNGAIYFSKNGTWQNSGDPTSGASKTGAALTWTDDRDYVFSTAHYNGTASSFNFGQREFAYPPGTASATDYFNAITWTGDGSNPRTLTGVGFQPDFVWIKARSAGGDLSHQAFDVVRGLSGGNSIQPDRDVGPGEGTGNGYLSAFTSDGFTVDTTSGDIYVNDSGKTYVAWCWKAGGTASTNTDGSITTTVNVSASNDAGFSIVTYEGTGTAATVGHGLSTAPSAILVKNRTSTQGWRVYHSALSSASKYLVLNTTAGEDTANSVFNGTAPTTSVFSIGDGGAVNNSGDDFVAYCWAEKSGVSKFGSFTGNGSSTGPFVECGFKPRMVIVKRTDAASNWFMYDTVRGTNNKLYADDPSDENGEDGGSTSSNTILSLSTGFQMTSGNGSNTSGGTYIFMAWAENFSADADFKALNTANLPAPEVKDGSDYFQTVLYTGNDSTHAITVADNSDNAWGPDFVWIKPRNLADHHRLNDIVRGVNTTLNSNENIAEYTGTNAYLDSFDSGGFTISSSDNGWNNSSYNYVAWCWDAGGSGSSNTDGSVTSTVSANPTAGFSVITYQANGTAGMSFGHGLGVAPDLVICKNRDDVNPWIVWHKALPETQYLLLNSTDAVATQSDWITTSSTTITWDSLSGSTTTNGSNYVVYAFAEVEGYSKFGSYTGNGSSDGPFVYCGFRPAWVMIKRTDSTQNWPIVDTKRDAHNIANKRVFANLTSADDTGISNYLDILSNGFKCKDSNVSYNASGGTYMFVAFAENPFGGSGVSPATAR